MEQHIKLQIYQGIIEFLLRSTSYDLRHIAGITNTTIKNIRSIYNKEAFSLSSNAEVQLIKVYQMAVEMNHPINFIKVVNC